MFPETALMNGFQRWPGSSSPKHGYGLNGDLDA
jgi:hypothetical protein